MRRIYGVGINDAGYVVQSSETIGYVNGKRKRKLVYMCPFFSVWAAMMKRCYSTKTHQNSPTYIGCSVVEEWLTFSNFRAWMEQQDWQGKQLDKDILIPGNKIYGPVSCVFVPSKVNTFLLECNKSRGQYPIGVHRDKSSGKYMALIRDGSGVRKYLGIFKTPDEAHLAWLTAKSGLAKQLAAEILAGGGDIRVANAIVERYQNYKTPLSDTNMARQEYQ